MNKKIFFIRHAKSLYNIIAQGRPCFDFYNDKYIDCHLSE